MSDATGLQLFANIATIIAATVASIGIYLGVKQLKLSTSIAKANFLLELEKLSERFDDIHMNLRPGGKWAEAGEVSLNDLSRSEIIKLEDYMGFFEHCELLINKGVLSGSDFYKLFGYRLYNLNSSGLIGQKVSADGADSWVDIIALKERIGIK